MINIFLDDIRPTPEGYLRVYTVEECISALIRHRNDIDILSLDNDLGIGDLSQEGRFITKWMAEMEATTGRSYWPKRILIHSANPVARKAMESDILRYGMYAWDPLWQGWVRHAVY